MARRVALVDGQERLWAEDALSDGRETSQLSHAQLRPCAPIPRWPRHSRTALGHAYESLRSRGQLSPSGQPRTRGSH